MSHYKHTQIGWVILGIGGFVALVLTFVAWQAGSWFMAAIGAASLLPLLLFSALTTSVDDEKLELRFGPGFPGFAIPLTSIRSFTRVRTTLADGFGIHWTASGRVYNISGFDAVELSLTDGRTIKVGTDEPDRLIDALRLAAPAARLADAAPATGTQGKALAIILAVTLVPAALIVLVVLYVGTRPVTVSFSARSATVHGGMYSDEIPFSSIESVSLEPALPPIVTRTNGFAAGGSLRGNFRLRDGKAHLFVERRYPPFVAVRTYDDYVLVNFKDRSETEQLFVRLQSARNAR